MRTELAGLLRVVSRAGALVTTGEKEETSRKVIARMRTVPIMPGITLRYLGRAASEAARSRTITPLAIGLSVPVADRGPAELLCVDMREHAYRPELELALDL